MKDLTLKELYELNGGGFAYDVGCGIRYLANFTVGYFKHGGPGNLGSVYGGVLNAEVGCCPS
ncbi:hypothetical protein [Echinicola shivajiensis]|uniref:hypothetical protein n=1 Tax=Echinicola shivajiensis TaxID=1035916 RepID=UPI001BFC5AC9|nr:hypothetical protein [Echinicola shivajiensis]